MLRAVDGSSSVREGVTAPLRRISTQVMGIVCVTLWWLPVGSTAAIRIDGDAAIDGGAAHSWSNAVSAPLECTATADDIVLDVRVTISRI